MAQLGDIRTVTISIGIRGSILSVNLTLYILVSPPRTGALDAVIVREEGKTSPVFLHHFLDVAVTLLV